MKDYITKINNYLIGKEEIQAVEKVLRTGLLSRPEGGPVVKKFQEDMAGYHGRKFAYATTSGTSALHVAISALELKRDDEVLVPALANIADCSVVIQEGAKPVYVDIDPEDFNIDVEDMARKITSKTKAILVVHMYGQPARMEEIMKIADKHNLVLIEDCAQAAGAVYKGKPVGAFGDISCFSLYQTKHIVCGEGGMVLTDNEKYYEIIRSISNNGIKRQNLDEYDYDRIGYNYQLTDMQAAVGIEQLKKLDRVNDIRIRNVALFKEYLKNTDLEFQKVNSNTKNVYFYLAVLLPRGLALKRAEFMRLVSDDGTPIKKLYPLSLPELELIRRSSGERQSCPVAEAMTKRVFNLYVNPGLEKEDIERMSESVLKAYKQINS